MLALGLLLLLDDGKAAVGGLVLGVKGSSGMIELGWQVKPGKKSPMEIDIGVAGWVGKQRGITANVQANWTF